MFVCAPHMDKYVKADPGTRIFMQTSSCILAPQQEGPRHVCVGCFGFMHVRLILPFGQGLDPELVPLGSIKDGLNAKMK